MFKERLDNDDELCELLGIEDPHFGRCYYSICRTIGNLVLYLNYILKYNLLN